MSIIFKIAGSLRRCYTGFMSLTLKDLDPKIRQSAIRLPYRVGLWMSLADGTGGNTSDKEEQKALETLIMAYSEDFVKSQFVQALMEECMKERGDWINWVENIEDVPKECRDVIAALNGKLERGDIEAFKSNLIEIGGFVQRSQIVIAKQTPLTTFSHQIDTLNRIWSITEHITQTDNAINPALVDAGQDHLQRFKVAMNITDDCGTHA